MSEVMSTGPILSDVVSQLLEKINNVSNELLSLLERTSDQISTYSNVTVGGLVDGSALLLTDKVILYLKRLRFHFQELFAVLETGDHNYESTFLMQMITDLDQEISDFMATNVNFKRSYGWYINNDITPLFSKSITKLQLVAA